MKFACACLSVLTQFNNTHVGLMRGSKLAAGPVVVHLEEIKAKENTWMDRAGQSAHAHRLPSNLT